MTTIAWDGKTLATDSFGTRGDTVVSFNVKKLFLDVGPYKAVAFAGTYQDCAPLIDWIKSEHEGDKNNNEPKIESAFNLVCIDEEGQCFTLHDGTPFNFVREESLWTSGSGQSVALGALHAGAKAVEAVEIATVLDTVSGGDIQSYTVGE